METPHRIIVTESATEELRASGAKLTVRISGRSFFTGTQAFKKAEEVAALIDALKKCGMTEDDITLRNVSSDVSSGKIAKSSAATYHLQVTCSTVDNLGSILAAIASQKNASMSAISWQFPDLKKTKRELLQKAVVAAKDSAQLIAAALGTTLQGVHKLSYETRQTDSGFINSIFDNSAMSFGEHGTTGGGLFRKSVKGIADDLEGLSLSHITEVAVVVTAEFIVGMFGS